MSVPRNYYGIDDVTTTMGMMMLHWLLFWIEDVMMVAKMRDKCKVAHEHRKIVSINNIQTKTLSD